MAESSTSNELVQVPVEVIDLTRINELDIAEVPDRRKTSTRITKSAEPEEEGLA